MIFENDIIESIVYRERIYKYIFFDNKGLYFFDISCYDENPYDEYDDAECSPEYTSWITKKCKSSDNTSSKMDNKKKNNPKTNKIRRKSYQSRSYTRWQYSCEEDSIGRIATRKYWAEGSTKSNRSPDSLFLICCLKRVLGKFFNASFTHKPCPYIWENKRHRKKYK